MALKRLPARAMGLIARMAPISSNVSGEIARALPDSKGGEEPKDLQRWRADASTLFTTTIGESVNFYNADQWVKLKLELETAGNVSIGIGRSDILPVLSGKGRLLSTAKEWEIFLPKGTRCYYAATSANRIGMTIEPIPWMEQLSMEIQRVAQATISSAQTLMQALTGQKPAQPMPAPSLPASLQRDTRLSRLTTMDPARKV